MYACIAGALRGSAARRNALRSRGNNFAVTRSPGAVARYPVLQLPASVLPGQLEIGRVFCKFDKILSSKLLG